MPIRRLVTELRTILEMAAVKAPKHLKGTVAKTLDTFADGIERGAFEPAINLLKDFLAGLQMKVGDAEDLFTKTHTPEAPWYYALGPKLRKRFHELYFHLNYYVGELERSKVERDRRRAAGNLAGDWGWTKLADGARLLVKDIAWLEDIARKDPQDEMPHGPWTVVVMKGVSPNAVGDCLDALDAATARVQPKFPQLCYGKVFISKSVGMKTIANYVNHTDSIALGIRAKTTMGDVHVILHELAHRFYHRFWKDTEQKNRFRQLSTEKVYKAVVLTVADRERLADEFFQISDQMRANAPASRGSKELWGWVKELRERRSKKVAALAQKYVREKDDSVADELRVEIVQPATKEVKLYSDEVEREPLYVTEYGKTSWTENFSEAFAHWLLGKKLPPELAEIMEKLAI